ALRRPAATGLQSVIGATGVALTALNPQGQVKVRGEIWRARVQEGSLNKDDRIEVLGTQGLTLIVQRSGESSPDENCKTAVHGSKEKS
ncbi:MAG: hypothetical protein H5T84_09565, partial [Thermoleophilia bacterium]|nr:hypothetical protein [Thermoleophilia bacterium]